MEQQQHPRPTDLEDEKRQTLIRLMNIDYIMSINNHRIAQLTDQNGKHSTLKLLPTETLKVDVPSV